MDYSESLGHVFYALADPTRRAVIQRLGAGPASTKELAQPFNMALPSFMQHLTLLENSGLIASKKIGRVRTWEIKQEELVAAESWIVEQRALWQGRTDRFANYVETWYEREIKMTENSNDFTVSRHIKAPRRVLWKAWTMPEHLEKWWCPAPMTCKVMGLDPRPGGAFDILMRDPGGPEMSQTGAFLEIVPEERIVFTTALTDEWRPAASFLPITAIISMADENDGTRYETRVLYKDEEERQKLGDMRFEAGWSLAIDQLGELVAQLKS
jgi:uncharacterized protein YndB with AHSA1/START domain/DNA-binding transcriptional ArsR family regulator